MYLYADDTFYQKALKYIVSVNIVVLDGVVGAVDSSWGLLED